MKKTIKITDLEAIVKQAHEKVKNLKGGKNADYIPFLAKIDPNLFGIAVCLPTGEVIEAGDTTYVFGIESISKVHTAVLILKQYGAEAVLKKIGADATGLPFNSIMAILLEKDHPSTPLVNAGAISADSMVKPIGDPNSKWAAIADNMADLCGSELILQDELYKSESAKFQQSFYRLVIEKLQPDLRRSGHVAGSLYPTLLYGSNDQTVSDSRLYDS